MNLEGVKIKYGDVAPEAKESFTTSTNNKADFVQMSQLQSYNLKVPNYGNPCEYLQCILDSTAQPMPYEPENSTMGYWSVRATNSNGDFDDGVKESNLQPIVFTMTADKTFTSKGMTITFDTYNNFFCNSLNIKWYLDDTLKLSKDFTPNSAFYYCAMVESGSTEAIYYNKVIITFNSMCLPHIRLKIFSIDFGYGTFFFGDELRDVTVEQSIDPISSELPIGTVSFSLDSKSDMVYSFQTKQPLNVYFNGELRATTFVTKSKRVAEKQWTVDSEDYIGQMDALTFLGDIYTNKNVTELLNSMFTSAKIPVEIDTAFANTTISGLIPVSTMRDALRQICFAIGAVADTSNRESVKIMKLSDELKEHIPKSRIRQGWNTEESEKLSAITLEVYTFTAPDITSEEAEWENLYLAEKSGTGDNILVTFNEPCYNIVIYNGDLVKHSATYAIINARAGCQLKGYKYKQTSTTIQSENYPNVSATEHATLQELSGATLVTEKNAQEVLTRLYNYYAKTNKLSLSIIEGYTQDTTGLYGYSKYGQIKYGQGKGTSYNFDKVLKVGDAISADAEYLGTVQGTIISEKYSCNGKILVKECEVF